MEPTGSGASDSSKGETPLIYGLPDDIALLCLVRVPRTYHANLKCVSKRWRKLVSGEEWRVIRKKHNLEETWIYAFCLDNMDLRTRQLPKYYCYVLDPYAPTKCWKRIQDLPPSIVQRQSMHFEVLGQKAYLIGGRDFTESEWSTNNADNAPNIADEVYCYDATTNSWSKATPLSTPRCHFASEVLDGKIYAVGSEMNPVGKRTWEAYDPITNTWTTQSYPKLINDCMQSIVYNGKLYLRNATFSKPSGPRGVVYEPSTSTWHDADSELVLGWCWVAVVADGRLYSLDDEFNLMVWEEDRRNWVLVVDLSPYFEEPPYRLVAIGKSIFFIGRGLATTKLDLSNVGNNGGGTVSISEIARSDYDARPIGCKGMTI